MDSQDTLALAPRASAHHKIWLVFLIGFPVLGSLIAVAPPVAAVFAALAIVFIATRYVEKLAFASLWTLPYMVVGVPTGGFTLKLCDAVAYLFAAALVTRALLRRERIAIPPATVQMVVYIIAMVIATAFAPPVSNAFLGGIAPTDRNSPNLRPISLIIWMTISWLVVIGYYHVFGGRPELFRRAIRTFILSAGLASALSLVFYAFTISGHSLQILTNLRARNLAPASGDFFRLAGVAYEPLLLAFFLSSTIPATYAVIRFKPSWVAPRIARVSLVLQTIAILATFSAGGWVSILVALALFTYWTRDTELWAGQLRRLVGRICLVTVVGGAVIASVPVLTAKMGDTVQKITGGGDETRKGEWTVGLGLVQDYPFLGVGPGLANYYFPKYHPSLVSQRLDGSLDDVNNIYLSVLSDTGIVGGIAWGWWAVVLMTSLTLSVRRYGGREAPLLAAFTASLYGCAMQFMAMNSTTLTVTYFSALAGLALAATRPATPARELVSADPAIPGAARPRDEGQT